MKESVTVDVTIIGGGIIGLSVAKAIKDKFSDLEIAVFDKEAYLGEHSSGRNSGVLHAGIYYPHGSLKHRLCLEGNKQWEKLCSELGIGVRRCGKFIFTTSSSEDLKLSELCEKAAKNEVPVREASAREITELQYDVNAHRSLYSPSTGIIDISEALSKLRSHLEGKDVHIYFSHEVDDLRVSEMGYEVSFRDFNVQSSMLINCAGLSGVSLRKKLGLDDLQDYYVRGHYLSTSQKLSYHSLYYPLPPADLKGLGIHSTIDLEGRVKFGPNTEEISGVDYSPPKEDLTDMKKLVSFYFKNIDQAKLYWDYAGCRSKIKHNEILHTDFWIKSPIPNYVECLGIESPGVTAAPAIAKFILENFL